MKKIQIDTIVFDFDSTILRGELLEILANYRLKNNPERKQILAQIKQITDLGMEGKIPFRESLSRRLGLLDIKESVISEALGEVKSLINSEYLNLLGKICDKKIHIVSGGYKNIIDRLSSDLKVSPENIHAINLIFDNGKFSHFDQKSPLVESDGKAKVVAEIANRGTTLMVGDGMTDYKVRELGAADYFAAYIGVAHRPAVAQKADFVLQDLCALSGFII